MSREASHQIGAIQRLWGPGEHEWSRAGRAAETVGRGFAAAGTGIAAGVAAGGIGVKKAVEEVENRGHIDNDNLKDINLGVDVGFAADSFSRIGQPLNGPGKHLRTHLTTPGDIANYQNAGSPGEATHAWAGGFGDGSVRSQEMGAGEASGIMSSGVAPAISAFGLFDASNKLNQAKARRKRLEGDDHSAAARLLADREVDRAESWATEQKLGAASTVGKVIGGYMVPGMTMLSEGGKAMMEGSRSMKQARESAAIRARSTVGKGTHNLRRTIMEGMTDDYKVGRAKRFPKFWAGAHKRAARKRFLKNYHEVVRKSQKGDNHAYEQLRTGKWSAYHQAHMLNRARSWMSGRKAAKATEHGVMAMGHSADAVGSVSKVGDLGITQLAGKGLKGGVGAKRIFGKLFARIMRVHRLRKVRNELGQHGKKKRGIGWGIRNFLFGNVRRMQSQTAKMARARINAGTLRKSRGNHLINKVTPAFQRHSHFLAKTARGSAGRARALARKIFIKSGAVPEHLTQGPDADQKLWKAKEDMFQKGEHRSVPEMLMEQNANEKLTEYGHSLE